MSRAADTHPQAKMSFRGSNSFHMAFHRPRNDSCLKSILLDGLHLNEKQNQSILLEQVI